jgi:DNA primase
MFRQLMIEQLSELAHTSSARIDGVIDSAGSPPEYRPAPPVTRSTDSQGKTPVRQAIELLLYQPGLATEVTLPSMLEQSDQPGVPLLIEIIELIKENPEIATATLLEHWRDRDEGRFLSRLACWAPPLEELELAGDLQGNLNEIERQHIENRIHFLNTEQQKRALSETEKQEYGQLLQQSHAARQH